MTNKVAVVMKGYPRLSETFIAQELYGLQEAGIDFEIYALRRPHDDARHPVHDAIVAPVHYLPEYLRDAPMRVLGAVLHGLLRPGMFSTLTRFLRDFRRDRTRNRIRRLGQAFVLARELPADTTWLYAHFLHTPASVTRYAALLRGVPWSCSAHAKDIYTSPDWDLSEKLEDMVWLVTCTAANVAHLRDLAPRHAEKIDLLYHGLDFSRFPSPSRGEPYSDGPVRLLSVGRAVEKKGYPDVLEALARLPQDLAWTFEHVGGGDGLEALKRQADALGLAHRITWHGAQPQQAVLAAYHRSDVFVLASRIAEDGDRDGLPNVLMEAQSQGLACVATAVSAIPELIRAGETGLLVPSDDPVALAGALEQVIRDPGLRVQLGAAGEARVRQKFSYEAGVAELAERFGCVTAAESAADVARDYGAKLSQDAA
ncbi:MAG: glycosyltransferase family 4 protein [Pseudomonadota bacterium]